MPYPAYTPYSNSYTGFPVGYPGNMYQQQFYPAPPQYAQPTGQPQYAQAAQQPVGQTPQAQQTQQNVTPQPVASQPPVQDNRIYVQGEAGAAAYMVPRGTVVILWDSTQPIIYIKSTDSTTGRPYYLDVLDYTSRMQSQTQNTDTGKTSNVTYATAGELEALEAKWESRLEEVRAEYKPLLPLLTGDGKKGKPRLTKESDSENA